MLAHLLGRRDRLGGGGQPHPRGDRGDAPRRHPRAGQRAAAGRERRLRPGAARRLPPRGDRARVRRRAAPHRLRRSSSARPCSSTRRPTSSSTSPTPARATVATCASASPTSRSHDVGSGAPGVTFTDADGGAQEVRCELPRRGRRLAEHVPPGVPGGSAGSSRGSIPSPGSASSARRRRARPSSSTTTPSAGSR